MTKHRTESDLPYEQLASILVLSDSALPIGAFSHSFGMETLVAMERVEPEQLLGVWLSSEWVGVDGPAFVLAHRLTAAGSVGELLELDAFTHALRLPREWREAGGRIGRQLLALGQALGEELTMPAAERLDPFAAEVRAGRSPGQHAVVAGALFAACGTPLRWAAATFLMSAIQSAVAVMVRLVPLGQVQGQRLIARLYREHSAALVAEALSVRGLADLGSSAPYFEIAGMQHEVLQTRLFIS